MAVFGRNSEYVGGIVGDVLGAKEKYDSMELAEGLARLEGVISLDLNYSRDGVSKVVYENTELVLALIHVIDNTENLETCSAAVEILSNLLQSRTGYLDNQRKKLIHFLTQPINYKKIFSCLHVAHELTDCDSVRFKLLNIFDTLNTKRPRHQFSSVDEKQIQIVGLLLASDIAVEEKQLLLNIAKQISKTKKFCSIIGTKDFFSCLQSVTNKTLDFDTAIRIIRPMLKCHETLNEMRQTESMISFIMDLIDYSEGTKQTKRQLMAALYKVAKKVPHKVSEPQIWQRLLKYFKSSERLNEDRFHMSIIKLYSLLNLSSRRKVIASASFNFGSLETQQDDAKSDDGEDESDDEEEETDINHNRAEDTDASDDEEDNESDCCNDEGEEITKQEVVSDFEMHRFFVELLDDSEWVETGRKVTFGCVNKAKHLKILAYPDQVDAEADCVDNRHINASSHQLDISNLIRRLKVVNGLENQKFSTKVVFDLDSLLESEDENGNYEFTNETAVAAANSLQNSSGTKMYFEDCTPLAFESRFESGNLRRAEQVGCWEYDLYLTPDTSTCKGRQWFYFRVSGMKKDQAYVFNVVNFDKINSQFNYGMQLVMFSVKEYLERKAGWRRCGKNIVYYGNHLTNEDHTKQYRSLTFTLEFPYESDACYLAYHYPYGYSKLLKQLYEFTRTDEEIYARVDNLCNTANNNCVPIVTVTASWKSPEALQKRPVVLLTARVHPGESNSSWIMDGLLKFLLDKNEKAKIAREHYIFKIIPMLNVEGVIFGNTRTGLNGSDLNRCWKNPSRYQHPEVFFAKKLVEYLRTRLNHPIITFIDIHGHSRKKNYFFYGCNPLLSWNKNDSQRLNYSNCQMIPDEMRFDGNMRASFCQYKIDRKKESTCRVVMWREFGIKGSLTLECSYCSGENKRVMTTQLLQTIGRNLVIALANIATKYLPSSEQFLES